jgi:hypothetical protein
MSDLVGKYVLVNLFNDYYHDGLYSEICHCDGIKDDMYVVRTINNKSYDVMETKIVKQINITNTQKFQVGSIVRVMIHNHHYYGEMFDYCEIISCSIFANTITYKLKIISSGKESETDQANIREVVELQQAKYEVNTNVDVEFFENQYCQNIRTGTIVDVMPWYDNVNYMIQFGEKILKINEMQIIQKI